MKKVIKSTQAIQASEGSENLSDALFKLQEVQSLCGKLEDYYFGQAAVDEFMKCYDLCTKAIACLDRANAKL